MPTPTLFTLPPHVRHAITALAASNAPPPDLKQALVTALEHADTLAFEADAQAAPNAQPRAGDGKSSATLAAEEATGPTQQGQLEGKREPKSDGHLELSKRKAQPDSRPDTPTHNTVTDSDTGASDSSHVVVTRRPATISEDVLDKIARWASTERGRRAIKRNGLEPHDYSQIALVAGAQVYYSPKQAALLQAAAAEDRARDKVNPYLPTHLSPRPPTVGTTYRKLSKDLSTVLNVLFSIFGTGGAFYAAASSVGWKRSDAVLLAIAAGAAVAVADVGLLWIFKDRMKDARAKERQRSIKLSKGSGREPGSEAKVLELDEEDEEVQAAISEIEAEMEAQRRGGRIRGQGEAGEGGDKEGGMELGEWEDDEVEGSDTPVVVVDAVGSEDPEVWAAPVPNDVVPPPKTRPTTIRLRRRGIGE